MRSRMPHLLAASLLGATVASGTAFAEIKKAPYPAVPVEIAAPVQAEPAFQAFWKSFAEAVAARNATALFALVGPAFVWTSGGALTAEFDPGREASKSACLPSLPPVIFAANDP